MLGEDYGGEPRITGLSRCCSHRVLDDHALRGTPLLRSAQLALGLVLNTKQLVGGFHNVKLAATRSVPKHGAAPVLLDDLVYPGVKVDRVLRDGDTIEIGDVQLTAHLTPGHTRGSTTWVANIVDGGKAYMVAFPDGAGFNPGYRLVKNPSYPGIADDYRRTYHVLEMLKPDIWLAQHNEYYDLEGKRARAATEGVKAWIDPEGFRRWVASKSALLKIR